MLLAFGTLVSALAAAFIAIWNVVVLKKVETAINGGLTEQLARSRAEGYADGFRDGVARFIEDEHAAGRKPK